MAGDFGRCPIEPTISFETHTKGRGKLLVFTASNPYSREFPTALVAVRATPRIRVRCISWSVVVDAGAQSTSAECGSPDWRIA